jgi:citronellol/citronellal dehydrogenase
MTESPLSLSDADLAAHPTNLAAGSFASRTVLVTGGGGGIGRAAAWLAARLGARVAIAGRRAERLEPAAKAMAAQGFDCLALTVDIRQRDSVDALFDRAAEAWGAPPDLLINSAGGQFPQPAIDYTEKGWRAVIDTNLTGTFNAMQAAARRWRDAQRPGSIVTIVVSPRGLHNVAHTCAARAGVKAFSEAVAVEWAPLGIRVNCIAPGAIRSEGWQVYQPEVRARYENSNPLRIAGSPWQVAEAALFIGGPAGGFITGETMEMSGGGHLWGETWTTDKPQWFRDATKVVDPGSS